MTGIVLLEGPYPFGFIVLAFFCGRVRLARLRWYVVVWTTWCTDSLNIPSARDPFGMAVFAPCCPSLVAQRHGELSH